MPMPSCFIVSPTDSGVTYLAGNRLFNFRVESHGDHVHCDMSIHIVRPKVFLGGSRYLPTIHCRDFGACRFRIPVSDSEWNFALLMALTLTEQFQEFLHGPLDDLAGNVDPERFGMLPD